MSSERSMLVQAEEVIYGDREKTYGDPGRNIRTIAGFWNQYISSKYGLDPKLDANDVCAMMRLLKESRLINSPDHMDSFVDLCGYAALAGRIQHADKTKAQEVGAKP